MITKKGQTPQISTKLGMHTYLIRSY